MNHCHIELIDDPQWVSYCVERECSFRDNVHGYLCRAHCTRHVCTGFSCAMVKQMATRTQYRTEGVSACPVTDLLVFHKPQMEFRGAYYMPNRDDVLELGYGGLECESATGLCRTELEGNQIILKASLPAMIALFSTALSDRFAREYESQNNARGPPNVSSGAACSSWMTIVFDLAKEIELKPRAELSCRRDNTPIVREAALKSAAAMVTLFESRNEKIARFMKKLVCKYNDKHRERTEFYAMVIMVTLCFFPYLKHRVLGEVFNNRTLVIMCFDKTITKHSQWSTLSTHIHLHVNQPEFVKGVLLNSDLATALPVIVTVTLDKYMSDAIYPQDKVVSKRQPEKQCCSDPGATTSNGGPKLPVTAKRDRGGKLLVARKRTKSSFAGYYEDHEGRLTRKCPKTSS